MVAHLQRGVIVNKWRFKIIDSDPVDAALFTVKLDSIEVDHGGENGQLNKSLRDAKEKKVGQLSFHPISSKSKYYLITGGNFFLLITIIIIINGSFTILYGQYKERIESPLNLIKFYVIVSPWLLLKCGWEHHYWAVIFLSELYFMQIADRKKLNNLCPFNHTCFRYILLTMTDFLWKLMLLMHTTWWVVKGMTE